jgi:hypothetical protein
MKSTLRADARLRRSAGPDDRFAAFLHFLGTAFSVNLQAVIEYNRLRLGRLPVRLHRHRPRACPLRRSRPLLRGELRLLPRGPAALRVRKPDGRTDLGAFPPGRETKWHARRLSMASQRLSRLTVAGAGRIVTA